jgi:tetratricopeptide (TPR) repeat protein
MGTAMFGRRKKLDGDQDPTQQAIVDLRDSGAPDEEVFESLFAQGMGLDTPTPEPMIKYAQFLISRKGDLDGAEAHLQRAMRLNNTDPEMNLLVARFYDLDKQDNFDVAEVFYNRAVNLSPDDAKQRYMIPSADFHARRKGDLETAFQMYDHAYRLDPTNTDALFSFCRFLTYQYKDYALAETCLQILLKIEPEHADGVRTYAHCLAVGIQDPIRAREMYERAIELDRRNVELLRDVAAFLGIQND